MNFDLDLILKAASFFGSIGAVAYTFFATRQKDLDVCLDAGSERMDRHERRITSLEQTVAALPDRGDIHKLELHMTRIGGTMERMEAVMEGNQKIMSRLELIVSRHEDHLLDGAKR